MVVEQALAPAAAGRAAPLPLAEATSSDGSIDANALRALGSRLTSAVLWVEPPGAAAPEGAPAALPEVRGLSQAEKQELASLVHEECRDKLLPPELRALSTELAEHG
jgi:hypothetical protein